MAITHRRYKDSKDYRKICAFLEKSYESYGTRFDDNLTLFEFQTALACGLEDPVKSIDEALSEIFLWFDDAQLVGILGQDTFCIHADYRFIYDDLVRIREDNFQPSEWEIYDKDDDYERTLITRGYGKTEEYWVRRDINLKNRVSNIELPEGFYIESVPTLTEHEEVYDAYKLCYGIVFNQDVFQKFYETSTYRKELDLVVMSPDHHIVALCSGRYDNKNRLVTIEAVSCYHQYRKRGISKALILHLLNVAKKLGAEKATVYTAMPEKHPAPNNLYESIGFKMVGKRYVWKKEQT